MKVNLKNLSIFLIVLVGIVLLSSMLFNKAKEPMKLKKDVFVYEYGTEINDLNPSQFLIADDEVLSNTVLKMKDSENKVEQGISVIYDNSGSIIAVDNLQVGEYPFIAKYKNVELKFIIKIV